MRGEVNFIEGESVAPASATDVDARNPTSSANFFEATFSEVPSVDHEVGDAERVFASGRLATASQRGFHLTAKTLRSVADVGFG